MAKTPLRKYIVDRIPDKPMHVLLAEMGLRELKPSYLQDNVSLVETNKDGKVVRITWADEIRPVLDPPAPQPPDPIEEEAPAKEEIVDETDEPDEDT